MGKFSRCFEGLLRMKKEKETKDNVNGGGESSSPNSDLLREKRKFNFGRSNSGREPSTTVSSHSHKIPAKDEELFRSYLPDLEEQQNKHAIAVAAATAAAADGAVAAAQAAVAVLRLTSNGNRVLFNRGKERWAAVKIQSVFRGFLARKALRALKGLVKIQALVRGFVVRNRAAATLHSLQALIRAQTAVISRRPSNKGHSVLADFRPGRFIERYDETRLHSKRISSICLKSTSSLFDESPEIVRNETFKLRSRSLSFRYNGVRCNSPSTPSKSVCGDGYFRPFSNQHNYMAPTQSFKAKVKVSSPRPVFERM